MAKSNRNKVGDGFELLAEGLASFVDEVMSASAPAGRDWTEALEARDSAKFGTKRTYAKNDPQVQLRVITEEWRAGFGDRLSRAEQSIASYLREVRNKWAHNGDFSADDTVTALDMMERLLGAVGAVGQARQVRTVRMDHLRSEYEKETRKAVKEASVSALASGVPGKGVKAWRDVIEPHDDVASGRFKAAEFAADLDGVARSEGSVEYVDPTAFFGRTYLTGGLQNLLKQAAARLTGDLNASPVINLQTNFGGGKTHSMLALYHLASGRPLANFGQEVQDLLAGTGFDSVGRINRVTLVGNRISARTGVEHEDEQGKVQVNTLWGELAWQLGGRAAYERVALDDEDRTNPGRRIQEVIAEHSPCLILIDEWVAYARELYGREDLPAGSFATQFGFAQTLTEAVKAVPGAMLVISIPASSDAQPGADPDDSDDLEVGGLYGRQALRELQNVVGRIADSWQPATADESFEIVRRRLFKEPSAAARADIAAVARQFVEFYRSKRGEFPPECSETAYEGRIKAAYPIHPKLLDVLYQDWSSLPRFQRTRGVLRLMSAVVHALWKNVDSGPLIMPGSIRLDVSEIADELTQYVDPEWKAIIHKDVDGGSSTPAQIDADRSTFGSRQLTRRLARTVFVGSVPTLRTAHKGIDRQDVWLGVAVPGDTPGNFGSALDLLAQRATHFYPETGRYWYDTQASVSRTAQDTADRLREQPEVVHEEIIRRLKRDQQPQKGDFAAVYPGPRETGEVPDTEDLRLVLLHPKYTHGRDNKSSQALDFVERCLRHKGSAQRININQLVFLAPYTKRMDELEDAVRLYLAWKDVTSRSGAAGLNLTAAQEQHARAQAEEFDRTADLRIAAAYTCAFTPEQPDPARPYQIELTMCEGAESRLAVRASSVLARKRKLTTAYSPSMIRYDLDHSLGKLWEHGHVSLAELWALHVRHPYLYRLRDRSVLDQAALSVMESLNWHAEGFALAEGFDEGVGRYLGLAVPPNDTFTLPTDTTLLVRPERAEAQRTAEAAERAARAAAAQAAGAQGGEAAEPGGGESLIPGGGTGTGDSPAEPTAVEDEPKASNVRFFGVYPVDPERAGRDFGNLVKEILPHLQSEPGSQVRIRVEIEAVNEDGYPDDKVRFVNENARTLKFEAFGFDD